MAAALGKGVLKAQQFPAYHVRTHSYGPLHKPLNWTRNSPGPGCRHICRVTNTTEEIWRQAKLRDPSNSDEVEDQQWEVWDPDKGPLERRVSRVYLEALANNEVDMEETAYWFSPPEGGWQPRSARMKKAQEVPAELPCAEHEGPDRTKLEDLEEGQVLEGVVTDIWLYHGAEIDIGAEYDCLLPIREEEWPDVCEFLEPGQEVKVRIHRLKRPKLYRWPIHVTIIEPDVQAMIMHPDEFESAVDLGWAFDQGWDIQDICEETGRSYTPTSYYPERDINDYSDEIQQAYGWDEPDINGYEDDEISDMMDVFTVDTINSVMTDEIISGRD